MTSVKRNIVWNLLGNGLPLLAGLIFFPLIVKAYGLERFGLLSLAWSLVGYFGLFDLGLSRALTQMVSVLLARKQHESEVAELIRTGFRVMWLLGLLGGVVLWLSSPYIVTNFLHVSNSLQQETIVAFSLLAVSIPVVVHTSAMRGVLEALHLFKVASIIRTVMGVGTFLGPFIATYFSDSLLGAIYALLVVRFLVWILHVKAIRSSGILATHGKVFASKWLKQLFSFGGWMTLTNIIGPLMVYLDRFVVVSVLGAASVAFYVAPYEVITKMLVIPVAISGVLFPVFSKEWESNPLQSATRLNQGIRYTLLLLYPVSLILVYFAQEWLSVWLGDAFAAHGRLVVMWLAAGVLVNSAAQIVFAKVQGAGRSDWTAKLHLLELTPYLIILWWALREYGIAGAAFAWFARVLMDMIGLTYFASRISPHNFSESKQSLLLLFIATVTLLGATLLPSFFVRGIIVLIALLVYTTLAVKQLRQDHMLHGLSFYFKKL